MFNFKKKREEFPEKVAKPVEPDLAKILEEVNSMKIQNLAQKVAEQEIIIQRLLDLVVMNIEHKDYSKYLRGQIAKVQTLLDKTK